jgi:hypothetical protein
MGGKPAMFVRTMNAKCVVIASIVAGVLATGCAAIVGADDYNVDKTSASTSGGTGGSQGSGGGSGGATGATGGATGATGGSTGGGGTAMPPDGGRGGMAGMMPPVQDAGRDAVGPRGAGEMLCMTNNNCPAGQQCLITAFSPPGLCTYSCETLACDADHDCVHSNRPADMFPNSCVKKCPVGVTCPNNMLCVPISTGPVCLPTGWFDGLGIGDDCFADEQCVSGACRRPGGFCTKPCGPADPLCAHDAQNFPNRNNELNWCVTTGAQLSCVPGCDASGATTCALYPGTTCRMVTDVTMTAQMACLP